MSAASTSPPPLALEYTTFRSITDKAAHRATSTWPELVDKLMHPDEHATKKDCPLLKLATFGDQRSPNGALRHADNMNEITGVECDYDGEKVSIEQARALLDTAKIACLLHTSASHTTERPRWRVLCPLSVPCMVADRRRYVGMLNTALGGILAPESFTDAQPFFYGKVSGVDYQALRVKGHPIDSDEHSGIEPTYPKECTAKAQQGPYLPAVAPADDLDRAIGLNRVNSQTLEDLKSALARDPATGKPWIDADDRVTWIAVAHDLKCLGEKGYALWSDWGAISPKFKDGRDDPRSVWDNCAGERADYRAVFTKAQANGWVNPKSAQAIAANTTAENRVDRTDMGNVNVLAGLSKGDIRYVPETKHWLCWRNEQWTPDHSGENVQSHLIQVAEHYAEQVLKLRTQAQDPLLDTSGRKHLERDAENLNKWARNCRNRNTLAAMRGMAECDGRFTLSAEKLNTDPWLIGVNNGVVDLRTGTLRPASRDEFVTRRSPVAFNPEATAPRWHQFIAEITSTPSTTTPKGFVPRPELARYLQKALGYCLSGSVQEHKMFICVGEGSNGKSVLLDTVLRLLGDYGQTMAPEALMSSVRDADAERATPFKFKLVGARAAFSAETKDGQKLDMALVKQHTGGGFLTARALHGAALTFEITHKLWLMTNHRPGIDHLDAATRGRLHIIPFDMRWNRPGEVGSDPNKPNADPTLADILKGEAEGVLAWLVAGAQDYAREGLAAPADVARMTREYFDEQDPLGQWLASCEECEVKQGETAATLHTHYRQWCEAEGRTAGTPTGFSLGLKARGIKNNRTKRGAVYGLRPLQDDDLA